MEEFPIDVKRNQSVQRGKWYCWLYDVDADKSKYMEGPREAGAGVEGDSSGWSSRSKMAEGNERQGACSCTRRAALASLGHLVWMDGDCGEGPSFDQDQGSFS